MSWKGKRVLVTGGTGFIGSFLVEALLDAGASVRVPARSHNFRTLSERRGEIEWMEGDLRQGEYCAQLVEGMDAVFHLASCRRTQEYHDRKCGDIAVENVRMTVAMLEGLKEHPAVPVTFFSSANIPPQFDLLSLPQQEKVDGYALGKLLCESLWLASARQREFPLLIVRPVGVYGPRDTFAADGNIVPALMVEARSAREELVIWGDGEAERSFLYVEDLIGAVLKLIEKRVGGIQYIHAPDVLTVRELAERVRDLVKPGLPIRFDTSKAIGARTVPPTGVHVSLRDYPWIPFAEGLKKTYEDWR